MSHFSLKSLSFYGIAISSVAVLFNIITAYGETNLKASPPIGGRYQLTTQTIPECLNSNPLILTIQQSGIYLNGSLLAKEQTAKTAPTPEEKPSLTGLWNNQQVNLSGLVELSKLCGESVNPASAASRQSANIQGKIEAETLTGQMILSSMQSPVEFTAKRDAPAEQQEKH